MKEDRELEALRRDAVVHAGDTAGGDLNDDEPAGKPYGERENFGSPGGDEPPGGTDPGRGVAGSARDRS